MREAVVSIGDGEFAAIGIGELVSLCRSAGLRDVTEMSCHGTGGVLLVEVETRLGEDRLEALECVYRWELVSEAEDGFRYVLAFTAPELSDDVADHADDLVGECDPEVSDRGATISLVGSRETIRETIGEYETAGMSLGLQKLRQYDGAPGALESLTDRQREVVRTAYDAGYYEIPREATTEDVAAELGVDPSTAAEHLQRAERNLMTRHLSEDR